MVARKSAARKTSAAGAGGAGEAGAASGDSAGENAADAAGKTAGAAKKAAAGKSTAKAAAREPDAKPAAKKSTAKKATARKAAAKKSTAGKPPAEKKAAPTGAAASQDAAKTTTGAETVAAKKTPVPKTEKVPTARTSATEAPGELAVRPGEDPWTSEEVEEARTGLHDEAARLRAEISSSEEALAGLMRDSGDGAGDDEADTGTKNITREHEMSLAANAREMLYQTERAEERLDAGTYGLCENCAQAIGKARMQAFPRATLCVECKQKQERR